MPAVGGQPLCLWARFALGLGGREHRKIIFGMALGDPLKLAGALQFIQRIEPRGVEQTILSDFTARIGGHQ